MGCLDIEINPNAEANKGRITSAATDVQRAINAYYKTHGKEVPINTRGMLADLLCEGAGDDILSSSSELVAKNQIALTALKREIERYERYRTKEEEDKQARLNQLNHMIADGEQKAEQLRQLLTDLQEQIKSHDGEVLDRTEREPALAGAKRAYDWVFKKTHDESLSAKAFNSYLLGGRYQEGDVYREPPVKFDAKRAIEMAQRHATDPMPQDDDLIPEY